VCTFESLLFLIACLYEDPLQLKHVTSEGCPVRVSPRARGVHEDKYVLMWRCSVIKFIKYIKKYDKFSS
jgi:hypothetical protein